MRFQLNFKSGKPVYLQVVDQVKDAATERYEQVRDTAEEYYNQGREKAQEWQNDE